MRIFALLLLLSIAVSAQSSEYEQSVEAFHQKRMKKLTSDDGYLTLVGLHWLRDKAVDVPGFGRATASEDRVTFEIPGVEGSVRAELMLDQPEGKQRLRTGTRSVYAIKRGDWIGLRVKDSQSSTRLGFKDIPRFEVSDGWRIPGRLITEVKSDMSVESVVGVATSEKSPGWAEFEWGGKIHRVRLIGEQTAKRFFLVFSDKTAGVSTYPACRFLYVERGEGDQLFLDFNKSINPACAFTKYATCPLPPPENVLPFAVEAGEKKPGKS